MTPRLLMQTLGTEWGRNIIHPQLWSNALFKSFQIQKDRTCFDCNYQYNFEEAFYPTDNKKDYCCPNCKSQHSASVLIDNPSKWIITDTRFPEELEMVKSRNGINIRIERNLSERTELFEEIPNSTHASETSLDKYCWIDNNIHENHTWYQVNKKVAKELFENGEELYLIYDDGTEGLCEDIKDIESGDYNYGLEYIPKGVNCFDYVIDNNGTLEELIEKVKNLELI